MRTDFRLPKLEVASSNLVSRSISIYAKTLHFFGLKQPENSNVFAFLHLKPWLTLQNHPTCFAVINLQGECNVAVVRKLERAMRLVITLQGSS